MNRTTVSHDAFELYLYALNDATLYQQQRERIEANLQRRFDAGTYDNDKAEYDYMAEKLAADYPDANIYPGHHVRFYHHSTFKELTFTGNIATIS